jgi:RNA polymerase primary sigma factor
MDVRDNQTLDESLAQAREACATWDRIQCEQHIPLAWNIARHYSGLGLDLDDLRQEAVIGLMRACELYDPGHGVQFSTYATHWIRQAIRRALERQARTIRLPAHVHQLLRRQGRGEELAANEQALVNHVRPCDQLRTSVDEGFTDPQSRETSPLDQLIAEEEAGQVDELLASLTRRTRDVVQSHAAGETHASIGRRLGLSRERVRQIESEALDGMAMAAQS